jgi:uncharacterized protein YeaO (DUF488 family)
MPDESLKIDVGDTDEQETEIDLEAPAQEKSQEEEIHVEQVAEDNSQPANASQESNEQSDVQASEQKKELDDYSEGVQKRIAKLTRKMREAIKYAQQMREQAEKTKNQFDQLGTNYTKELEQKVSTGIEAAKAKLKAAAEAGDIDAQVEAQKAVAQMAMEEARLNQLKVEQEARLKKTPQPTENIAQAAQGMPTSVDIAQAGRQLDPKAEAWATKNTWFGTDNAMTYTAFDIHRKLVEEEGFDPQSQEYYNEVDKRIRLEFPHKFDNVEQPTKEQPVQNVASAKRPAGKGRRKTVKLTPSQVAISKRLGVPLEEYAKQLAAKEG